MRRLALLAWLVSAPALADDSCAKLASLGKAASDAYLGLRPTTERIYQLSPSVAGQSLEDYGPVVEVALRADMQRRALSLASELPGRGRCLTQLQALHAQLRIFAGVAGNPHGYIDSWYGLEPFILNPISGPLIDVPEALSTNYRINRVEQAEDYVRLLDALGPMIASVNDKFSTDARQGWLPPGVVLERTLAVLEQSIAMPPERHPLYLSLEGQLGQLHALSEQARELLLTRARAALLAQVYPGIEQAIKRLGQVRQAASKVTSVVDLPGGPAFYREALRNQAATTATAGQLHAFGMAEVKRLQAQMAQPAVQDATGCIDHTPLMIAPACYGCTSLAVTSRPGV